MSADDFALGERFVGLDELHPVSFAAAVGVEEQSRERAAFLRDIGSFFLAVPSIRKDQIGMQTAYHFGCHAQAHALEFKLILLYLLFEKEADPWNISAVVCLVE